MSASPISLNGTTFDDTPVDGSATCAPIAIEASIEPIGKLVKAASGARTWVSRGFVRHWKIQWEDAPEATLAAVEAIAQLGATMTYVDERGDSYTVQCDEESLETPTGTISGDGTVYYGMNLTIHEAI